MTNYIVVRLATGFVTIIGVTLIVWGMLNLVPGDIVAVMVGDAGYSEEDAQQIKHDLGMDKPLPVRYVNWLGDIAQGDLGESLRTKRSTTSIIADAAIPTLEMSFLALVLGAAIGIPLGVWSAIRRDHPDDYLARLVGIGGISIPSFWIATMVIVLPARWWQWAPPLTYSNLTEDPWHNLYHLLIPATILAFTLAGSLMRVTRSAVLEVLRENYVRTARSKGIGEAAILYRHVIKNAILPVITVMGGQIAFLVTGSIVLETIFNIPGMGQTLITALNNRDYPVVTGIALVIGVTVVVVNLVVDILYRVFDPRIAY